VRPREAVDDYDTRLGRTREECMEDRPLTADYGLNGTVDLHPTEDLLSTCGTGQMFDDTQWLKRS